MLGVWRCVLTPVLPPAPVSCPRPRPRPRTLPSHPCETLPPPSPASPALPQLKRSLEALLALPGARKPTSVRFFRGQMQTIISRALTELDITPLPSRRCFALMSEWQAGGVCVLGEAQAELSAVTVVFTWCFRVAAAPHFLSITASPLHFPTTPLTADWLEDRTDSVYRLHPGYSDKASTLFSVELGAPQELPDALRGEKWAFVQLPLATLQQVGWVGGCGWGAVGGG